MSALPIKKINLSLLTMQPNDKYALARQMRGKVPEFGDDYIETYIPKDLLTKIDKLDGKMDDEKFWWGPGRIYAAKTNDNKPVVVYAQNYLGMGCSKLRVIDTEGHQMILTDNDLI